VTSRVARGRRESGSELTLTLDADHAAAGGVIRGEVAGRPGPATIALLRIEHSPSGVYAFNVGSTPVEIHGEGVSFELEAPASLPPQASGERCNLRYAVRATWRHSRWSRKHTVILVRIRPEERTVHEGGSRLDRIIPSQPARHFHLELVDALLEGGGHLTGRVHRDAGNAEPAYLVTAVCEEVWCTNFRFRTRRSPLVWEVRKLWSTSLTATVEPDAHWSAFHIDIPGELPQATEGRVIAWRYSVEARPAARRAFADRAVLTPLRFEV
jgi:hypothetical protein